MIDDELFGIDRVGEDDPQALDEEIADEDGREQDDEVEPTATRLILSDEQRAAIEQARQHLFTFICGTAGTGKTQTAKALVEELEGCHLCATTGIAAVNLGEGTTIHAELGFFDLHSLKQKYTDGHIQSKLRKLRNAGLRRIILDEVSMLSAEALTIIVRSIAEVNEGHEQLADVGSDAVDEGGGSEIPPIGLTLVGDFGQLPPVPDEDPSRPGKKLPVKFAFESPEWGRFQITKLTKIFRQDAQDFVGALHAVRRGDVRLALEFFHAGRFVDTTDDRFEGSTIFAKNDAVDRYNQLRMDELTTPGHTIAKSTWGKQRGDWNQIPASLTLKEGALVMILANRREYEDDDDARGRLIYTNGDLGTFLGPSTKGGWDVRLARTKQVTNVKLVGRDNTIPLEPGRAKELKQQYGEYWEDFITEDGKSEIIGGVSYMPLRCAYGCTVHKTQGLSLDKVQINLRDPFFRNPAMLFVALSRCRTAEGLRIVGNQTGFVERCTVNPKVAPWI